MIILLGTIIVLLGHLVVIRWCMNKEIRKTNKRLNKLKEC